MQRFGFLGFGALIVIGTVGAITAQHSPRTHATATHEARTHQSSHERTHQSSHDMCGLHAGTGHHAEMAAALGLSAEQTTTIERISTEACAAMAKYHEQIQAVLTPEQRAKLQEHHGVTDHGRKSAASHHDRQ